MGIPNRTHEGFHAHRRAWLGRALIGSLENVEILPLLADTSVCAASTRVASPHRVPRQRRCRLPARLCPAVLYVVSAAAPALVRRRRRCAPACAFSYCAR